VVQSVSLTGSHTAVWTEDSPPTSSAPVDVVHSRASYESSLHECWSVCPRDCRLAPVTVTCHHNVTVLMPNRWYLRYLFHASNVSQIQHYQHQISLHCMTAKLEKRYEKYEFSSNYQLKYKPVLTFRRLYLSGQVHEKLDIHGKKLSLLHSYLISIFR